MVFKDPQWDWKTFDLDDALDAIGGRRTSTRIDAVDPDLKPFFARGGKLLMYHGWADPQTPPLNSVDYYTRVRTTVGDKDAPIDRCGSSWFPAWATARAATAPIVRQGRALSAWVERGDADPHRSTRHT